MALSIIGVGLAIAAFFIISDGVGLLRGENPGVLDKSIVGVTPSTKGDLGQPVSPKIGGSEEDPDVPLMGGSQDYIVVWEKLDHIATIYGKKAGDADVTKEDKLVFITAFLESLNYKMSAWGEPIVSKVNDAPISPGTVTCYLNGYIPGKPYLKPSCPSH